jgi:hypothetical protein
MSNTLTNKIKKALKIITPSGEAFFKYGPVEITFLPDEGRGYIDVVKTEGMGAFDLKKIFMQVKDSLPNGIWELNPDTPQKQRIYERWFKNDPTIKPSGDKRMAAIGREGFVLTKEKLHLGEVPDTIFQEELKAYQARRAGGDELNIKRVPAQFKYNGKLYTIQKGGKGSGGYQLKHSSERALKQATREATKLKQSPKLSSVEQMMVQNYYDDASTRGLQVDHEIPIEKGGLHHPSNMRLLTPADNAAKGARLGTSFQNVPLLDDVMRAIGNIPKPALGLIPIAGSAFDIQDAAARTQQAIKQPTPVNKLQASIAGAGAATTAIPAPQAQAVNIGAGLANMAIDTARYLKQNSQAVMRAIGEADFTRLIGF